MLVPVSLSSKTLLAFYYSQIIILIESHETDTQVLSVGQKQKPPKKWRLRLLNDSSGWRDGSGVKSTDCCSSRGPEFNSQQPHGGSQPSAIGSDALLWCTWKSKQRQALSFFSWLQCLVSQSSQMSKLWASGSGTVDSFWGMMSPPIFWAAWFLYTYRFCTHKDIQAQEENKLAW